MHVPPGSDYCPWLLGLLFLCLRHLLNRVYDLEEKAARSRKGDL